MNPDCDPRPDPGAVRAGQAHAGQLGLSCTVVERSTDGSAPDGPDSTTLRTSPSSTDGTLRRRLGGHQLAESVGQWAGGRSPHARSVEPDHLDIGRQVLRSPGTAPSPLTAPSSLHRKRFSAQEASGDNQPLHFGRALIELRNLGIAISPLDRVTFRVSISTVDLDCPVSNARRSLRGK